MVGVAVVYMFSFFDTYDLIRYLVAGDPKPDGFLLPPDWQNQLGGAKTKMTPKMNKIIGWCLLLTGAYVMYDRVIWPIVESIFVQLGIHWSMIYAINDVIPSIVVAVLLLALPVQPWYGGRSSVSLWWACLPKPSRRPPKAISSTATTMDGITSLIA